MMDDTRSGSTADLIKDTVNDLILLVRKEIELARIELTEGLLGKVKGIGLIAAAVVLLLPGLLFLSVALALALPGSAAIGFLVVGGLMFIVAGIAVAVGIWKLKQRRGPKVVVDSIRKDAKWARERLTR